jgi:hypothetical protein
MNKIKRVYQKSDGINSPILMIEYIDSPSISLKTKLQNNDQPPSIIINTQENIIIAGRKAWKSLFTEIFDLQQLKDWEQTIPKYECDCTNFYLQWKAMNPPQENIGFTWKWKLKNAVNQKLGQPLLSIEEAKAFWANFGVNTDG